MGCERKKPAQLALCGLLNITSHIVKLNRGGEEEDRTPDLRIANRKVGLLFIWFLDSFLLNWDNFGTQR